MHPQMLAIMLFFFVMTLLIGGMILVFPITRRLGRLLESKIEDKNRLPDATINEIRRLVATVEGLEAQIRSLSDRQEFAEKILDARLGQPTLFEKSE